MTTPQDAAEGVANIRRFMAGCSHEATRPKASEIAGVAKLLAPGAPLFLTALPGRPTAEMELAAAETRRNGLTPIPHISARHFATFAEIDAHLANLRAQAGVDQIMLIGGDRATPVGEVVNALGVIESGLLKKHALVRVHLPGFPDGHPHVDEDQIETDLVTKLAALQQRGIESEIVTQFSFETRPILEWLRKLRGRGVHTPVRVGLAGPTTLFRWLAYARRCGVKASAEALALRSGLVRHAFRSMTPDLIIRSLAEALATGRIENVRAHLFAFGGLEETAKWAQASTNGAIKLDNAGGFESI
ncbi:MAG: methylenetetrahydrofolate reductase [Beijerinckiaceae bacterium]|nr:methylenetetrahydrofolate reductase [Beijerinckiaceae bacterium]